MWVSGSDPVSSAMMLDGCDIDTSMSMSLSINAETNAGTPLYYTVRFLDSGKTAKVTTVGKYTTVEYTFAALSMRSVLKARRPFRWNLIRGYTFLVLYGCRYSAGNSSGANGTMM